MKKILTLISALFSLHAANGQDVSDLKVNFASIYDVKIPALDGKSEIDFSQFKGKKILIVNTASECGYTPQYKELQELYNLYKDNLIIVGVPANNYGRQEPGTNAEIGEFCSKNYGVTFLLSSKLSVDGSDQHDFFKWMTRLENPDFTGDIKWNFEKFLFDEKGKLIHRYRSGTKPMSEKLVSAIKS